MKPSHQWQTRRHRAFRKPERPRGPWETDTRAEAFELRFQDGTLGHATLGLEQQEADARAADDPDLIHAVQCWLVARGARHIALRREDGTPLAEGPLSPRDLGDTQGAGQQRLVTLCPSNAELVHALGLFDRVVACEDSSDYPPRAGQLPRLGPDLDPDLDQVAGAAPDLVVASLSVPGMERVVTGLRARGLKYAVLAPRCVQDVLDELSWLGTLLGAPEAAERARARMTDELRELRAQRPTQPARVYLEWWPKPMFTPGADCYSNELIELAGGRNVFADRPGSSVQIEPRDLLAAEPDVCFVSWCGVAVDKLDPDRLIHRPGLEQLNAARQRRVYPLDEAFSGRPGPRMLEAARIMGRAIRGEA